MNDATLIVPYASPGYGAPELKAVYGKNMRWGMVFSSVLLLAVIGSYHGTQWLTKDGDRDHAGRRRVRSIDLGLQPPLHWNQTPAVAVSGLAAHSKKGIPVPLPDAAVHPEQTMASQTELSATGTCLGEGTGGGDVVVEESLRVDQGPPRPPELYEKPPVIVRSVEPRYPLIAQQTGLEGTVFVKVWVEKDGRVGEVVTVRSDAEVFNRPAEEAASQFVFTPAIMQKAPVGVWVMIPFRFRLQSAK